MTEKKEKRILVVFNNYQGGNAMIYGTVAQIVLHMQAHLLAPPVPDIKDLLRASVADLRAIAKRKTAKLCDNKSQMKEIQKLRSQKDKCKSFIQRALRAKLIRKIPFSKRQS